MQFDFVIDARYSYCIAQSLSVYQNTLLPFLNGYSIVNPYYFLEEFIRE
jgi:hypothetical protein